MAPRDIVVVGGSAGGLEPLETLIGGLSAEFSGSVFIVWHIGPESTNVLADILDRSANLPVSTASNTDPFAPGHIYVAPADHHLLIGDGRVNVVKGPRENRVRPAIDPLFRSAATAYGPRVVGIVLTGLLNDGTAGLMAIKEHGGTAIVQDPTEARYPDMPESAINHVAVDHVLGMTDMAQMLEELARESIGDEFSGAGNAGVASNNALSEAMESENGRGQLAPFVCPDCGGPIWEIEKGSLQQLRCEIGHKYTAETFLDAKNDEVETALSVAERTLQERGMMLKRMAEEQREKDRHQSARAFEERAEETTRQAELIRRVLYGET